MLPRLGHSRRSSGSPEAGPRLLDLIIGLGHSLLGAAQGVLAVLVGGALQIPAALLGLLHHLVGPLSGLKGNRILRHQLRARSSAALRMVSASRLAAAKVSARLAMTYINGYVVTMKDESMADESVQVIEDALYEVSRMNTPTW